MRANGGVRFVTGGAGLTLDGQTLQMNNQNGFTVSNLTVNGSLTLPATATIFAGSSSLLHADGYYNFFVGPNAGNFNMTGLGNLGIGWSSLYNNTTGSGNVASGFSALNQNTTGDYNVASGVSALNDNTSGSNNVAVGYETLQNSTGDNGVVAIGYQALQNDSFTGGYLSIGSANVGVGYQSLQLNTSGSDNTAIGYQALNKNGIGYNNTALGVWALLGNTGGQNNTANGAYALLDNTTGSENVAMGVSALENLSSGGQNTAIGNYALQNMTSGSGNLGLGYNAGNSLISGNNNIYIGNPGAASDNNVIRIGNGQSQTFLAGTLQGNIGIAGGLNVDQAGHNIGNVTANALTFGASSGEGIASQRTGGSTASGQYGLEFYTDYINQMTILQNGNVGIGTNTPSQALEVNGNYVLVDGGAANNGNGPIDAYIGGSGSGSDVQIGSQNANITVLDFGIPPPWPGCNFL